MKSKCKSEGCYEPSDCNHGYCHKHCRREHKLLGYSKRSYPKTMEAHVGVEVEVEFGTHNDYRRALPLKGHADGSLPSCAAEFKIMKKAVENRKHNRNCASPIIYHTCRLLEELFLRRAKITSCCGLHVHLDMRQVNHERRTELKAWAQRTQEVWFKLVPQSRRANSFVQKIQPNLQTSHYSWLNITGYDTCEVRLHGGTLNVFKMTGWLSALIHLMAKTHDTAYQFPNTGDAEADFWSLFADAPKEAQEYLRTRKNNDGVIRDYAFAELEGVAQ